MVAINGVDPGLYPVKAAIFPLPDAANPIAGVSLVQLYVVVPPVLFVEKETGVVDVL